MKLIVVLIQINIDKYKYTSSIRKFLGFGKKLLAIRHQHRLYGTKEIEYLCKRFDLDFTTNLSLFRSYLDCDRKIIPAGLVPLINLLKIIPISTSEEERGFSAMNLICTDLRSSLTVENMSALLFIKINGPPIDLFDSEKYVKFFLALY